MQYYINQNTLKNFIVNQTMQNGVNKILGVRIYWVLIHKTIFWVICFTDTINWILKQRREKHTSSAHNIHENWAVTYIWFSTLLLIMFYSRLSLQDYDVNNHMKEQYHLPLCSFSANAIMCGLCAYQLCDKHCL